MEPAPVEGPEPAHPARRNVHPWAVAAAGVVAVGVLVVGAVAYLDRNEGPDQVWTPVSGYETMPPGIADEPEEVWNTQLTPEGGLSLDLELSRRGAWALSQLAQDVVLTRLDLGTGEPLWESDIAGERSIAFELELFGHDDALALSYEPAAGQTHIELYRPEDGSAFWAEDSADSLFLVTEGSRQPLLDGLAIFSIGPESVAVELETGTERWRAPLYPLVREGRLLASTRTQAQDNIAEVDPEDGSLRWETPISIPLIANGVLFLIDRQRVVAVELGTGEELWTETDPGVIAPATDETIVMVRDSEVVALDSLEGDVLWRHRIDLRRLAVPTANPVIVDGERLLLVPGADRMFVLRSDDGSEVSAVSLPEDSSVLAFAEGTAYIGAESTVHAYSLPDLEPLWTAELDQPVEQLVPVDEGLLVATRDTLSLLATPRDGSVTAWSDADLDLIVPALAAAADPARAAGAAAKSRRGRRCHHRPDVKAIGWTLREYSRPTVRRCRPLSPGTPTSCRPCPAARPCCGWPRTPADGGAMCHDAPVSDAGADIGRLYAVARAIGRPAMKLLWRVKAVGLENVPVDGPAIVCPNHISFLDSPFLMWSLPRKLTFVGKAEYLDSWKTKYLFPAVGMIPLDRSGGEASKQALELARRVLDRGELFGIYPEGTRSRSGKLHKGHTGAARLSVETGAPIIPVGIRGTDQIQPPEARLPRLFKACQLRFGKPMPPSRYVGRGNERLVLREMTDDVMYEIRELSGQEYVDTYATKKPDEGIPAEPAVVGAPLAATSGVAAS